VDTCPLRIGLFDVSQLSIAQGRTKSIAEFIYNGSNNNSVLFLPQVICDAKIIANLKQKRKKMRINTIINISTIIAISKITNNNSKNQLMTKMN
jgi:hypothetical protein